MNCFSSDIRFQDSKWDYASISMATKKVVAWKLTHFDINIICCWFLDIYVTEYWEPSGTLLKKRLITIYYISYHCNAPVRLHVPDFVNKHRPCKNWTLWDFKATKSLTKWPWFACREDFQQYARPDWHPRLYEDNCQLQIYCWKRFTRGISLIWILVSKTLKSRVCDNG